WSPERGLERHSAPPNWNRRMEDIEELSRDSRGRVAEYFASEPSAPPDLYERFHKYFTDLIARDPQGLAKKVGITTWWQVTGPHGGDWVIDFTRDSDWVRR